jgi:hypothetical protein
MSFLPLDFVVPVAVETDGFRMRMLTIHDLVKDYDAVMSSREHLWRRFGGVWGWPKPEMTLEQNLIDLGWHQKEFQRRSSFAYTVVTLDETRTLGCAYIDPPTADGTDAEVWFWARQSELQGGLEGRLDSHLRRWLRSGWGFRAVSLNGQVTALLG